MYVLLLFNSNLFTINNLSNREFKVIYENVCNTIFTIVQLCLQNSINFSLCCLGNFSHHSYIYTTSILAKKKRKETSRKIFQ